MTIEERKTALVFGGARGIGAAAVEKTFKRRLRCRLHICFATGQRKGARERDREEWAPRGGHPGQ